MNDRDVARINEHLAAAEKAITEWHVMTPERQEETRHHLLWWHGYLNAARLIQSGSQPWGPPYYNPSEAEIRDRCTTCGHPGNGKHGDPIRVLQVGQIGDVESGYGTCQNCEECADYHLRQQQLRRPTAQPTGHRAEPQS